MLNIAESISYEFGTFRFSAENRRLQQIDTGETVPLQPKAAELLSFLISARGRLLTKDEILEAVWPGSFVEESNLTQTVFVLRKALGEAAKQPRFILTVPNQGYQFVATVKVIHLEDEILDASSLGDEQSLKSSAEPRSGQVMPDLRSHRGWAWILLGVAILAALSYGGYRSVPTPAPTTVRSIRTIAILPLDDLSEGQNERYLGMSLADALANRIGKLKQITVRPTRATSRYAANREDAAKIGSDLQVDAILDGRIQRFGDRVRVSVQLIRTSDNSTIWAENFDDRFTNFFAVQDSISQQIVRALAIEIDDGARARLTRRGTDDPEAYQEFLLGRFFWNKRSADGLDRAIAHFKRSVELDPAFAQAHAGLAETYAIYRFYAANDDRDALPNARAAAVRALELDGGLAEAHTVMAYVQSQYDYDWRGAEQSYLRAIELDPNRATTRQWFGEMLAFQGRFEESLIEFNKAIELDPTSPSTKNAPALAYNASHQFEKALEVTDKVLQMDENFLTARHYRARSLFFLGRRDESLELARKVAATNGGLFFKADLGFLYGKSGDKPNARKILRELENAARTKHVSPYYFALLHLGLDERKEAFAYLRRAIAEHDSNIIVLKVGVNFDGVRNDPEFIEILQSANLQN